MHIFLVPCIKSTEVHDHKNAMLITKSQQTIQTGSLALDGWAVNGHAIAKQTHPADCIEHADVKRVTAQLSTNQRQRVTRRHGNHNRVTRQ